MALLNAISSGCSCEAIEALLDEREAANEARHDDDWLALAYAAKDLRVLSLLLDRGFGVDTLDRKGRPVIFAAVKLGNVDVVDLLLDRGARLDITSPADKWTVLHEAVEAVPVNRAVVESILRRPVNVDAVHRIKLRTPLHYAAMYGHTAIVRMLLEAGAKVDPPDYRTT